MQNGQERSVSGENMSERATKIKYRALILGASYGSLLSTKLMMAGHSATLICRASTADIFNREGSLVRMPIKGREGLFDIQSGPLPGDLDAASPEGVDPSEYDFVVLAMQEPQYSAIGVRELMDRIAKAEVPCVAITNMPLLPFLRRIPGLDTDTLRECFHDASIWDAFDPSLMTLCSPDPQAFRPPEEQPNVLQVRLPTNFKAARFTSDQHTDMLRQIEADIDSVRMELSAGEQVEVPVKLRVYESLFVPLAKWAMLMAGNYRCVQANEMRPIKDAVHSNLVETEAVYNWVVELCCGLGGDASDFVPFSKYAKAAESLLNPSSVARALAGGSHNIERVDKLVSLIAKQRGQNLQTVDETVNVVEDWISRNQSL